jgi:hypothetical protein
MYDHHASTTKDSSRNFAQKQMKANKAMKEQAVPNHRRIKSKKIESNIDSVAHNQTIKQQKQLNDKESPHTYQY